MEENNISPLMPASSKLMAFHDYLVNKKKIKLPEFDQFSEDMKDDTKRKSLYEFSINKGIKLPDYNTFSDDIGYPVKKKILPKFQSLWIYLLNLKMLIK